MFIFIGDVEILCLPMPVVGGDEVAYYFRQVVFLSQLQAVGHVVDDDLCALFVAQVLVRVDTALVFGEEHRIAHLPYVMIERSRTHQLAFCTDFVGCLGREVGHLHGVLERARCHFRQLAQQRVVDVGQFDEGHVGSEAEHLLQHEQERIGEQQEHAIDEEVEIHRHVELRQVIFRDEFVGEIRQAVTQRDDEGRAEQLRALREVAQAVDGRQAADDLQEEEVIRIAQDDGADEDGRHVGHEGRARIHEHADGYGQDGHGQHVDAQEVVGHHQRRDDGKHGRQRNEQQQAALALEVVTAEQLQVDEERPHENAHEEELSQPDETLLAARVAAFQRFLFVGQQFVVDVVGHDVAAVDDFLFAQHHALGRGDAPQQFLA